MTNLFGFLNIYKPAGMTSHDVVSRLRRVTKVKQIGHTGTLDPFAQGVLPIAIGKATRLIEFLEDDKEYLATVQFGAATTTYDIEGEATFTSEKCVNEEEVCEALKDFQGEISQLPPIYSAIKVKGKKLYEYARKGEEVEIEPRKVTVETRLVNFDSQKQAAQLSVNCSAGTYIRSIAHDLGEKLGVGGHLIKLIRTKAGKFVVENAIQLEDFDTLENVCENLINPLALIDYPQHGLTNKELERVQHGQFLVNKDYKDDDFVILTYNKEVAAIAVSQEGKLLTKKVFK